MSFSASITEQGRQSLGNDLGCESSLTQNLRSTRTAVQPLKWNKPTLKKQALDALMNGRNAWVY
jgi:hypothetical protein